MITFPLAFLTAFVMAALLTPLVRQLAHRRAWLDRGASSRNVHTQPTPRLGGIAIVVAFYAPLVGLLLVESSLGRQFTQSPNHVIGLFAGGLLITLLGVYDDLRGANAWQKLVVQVAVAVVVFHLGYRVEVINTIPGIGLNLGYWGGLSFTVIWIVGVINAMNLIDGLDGLASGVALLAVLTNLIVAAAGDRLLMVLFMCCLGGAILGFLLYNFNPASIFMGDSGSMFLGFVLATTSITANTKSYAVVAMATPILALGLPLMDTLIAIVRRRARGVPAFSADKEHIHHRLLKRGFSHRQTVVILYAASALFALFALGVTFANRVQATLLLLAVGVAVVVVMRILGYSTLFGSDLLTIRRKNRRIRAQAFSVAEGLRSARDFSEVWMELQPIALPLEASELRLEATPDRRERWRHPGGDAISSEQAIELSRAGVTRGRLSIGWSDPERRLTRDEEIALEDLRSALYDALAEHAAPPVAPPETHERASG